MDQGKSYIPLIFSPLIGFVKHISVDKNIECDIGYKYSVMEKTAELTVFVQNKPG